MLLLAAVTLFSYLVARQLEKPDCSRRKVIFSFFVIFELGILFLFKYLVFFTEMVNRLLDLLQFSQSISVIRLLLPIGISFYIFQTLGYVIDVYLAKIPAERHLGYYAASVAFFPILLSGPIERIPHLIKQLRVDKQFASNRGWKAMKQILLGCLKKVIIADSLAIYVDKVYADVYAVEPLSLLIAIFAYTIEIYCDFSGYSDIAIGIAKLLGIELHANFERPYLATSIKDFWRRWHISLTSWFRDYLYISLGGNRVAERKVNRNILVTFLLSGLWHGANWTFVIWGGIHGCLQILENAIKKMTGSRVRLPKWVRRIGVFMLVSVAWVFFRSDSIAEAGYVLSHCLYGINHKEAYFSQVAILQGMSITQAGILLFFILGLFVIEYTEERKVVIRLRPMLLFALFEMAVFYYMKFGTDAGRFIYFQF